MTRISKLLLPNPQKFIMLLLSPKGLKAFCRVFPPLSFHTMTVTNFVCIFSFRVSYINRFAQNAAWNGCAVKKEKNMKIEENKRKLKKNSDFKPKTKGKNQI